MPSLVNPIEAKKAQKARVGDWMFSRLVVSSIPLAAREIRFLAVNLAIHPNYTSTWLGEDGGLAFYERNGAVSDARFQGAIRWSLYEKGWGILEKEPDIPDAQLGSLDVFCHPTENSDSYILTHPWKLVKDYCTEGRTVVVKGPPGSGKSDIVTQHLGEVALLKQEHIANRDESRLERIHQRANRFFHATGTLGGEGDAGGDTGPGEERPSDSRPSRRGSARELDIVRAKDVAFLTNMSISPRSVLGGRHVPVDAISGEMLRSLERTKPESAFEQVLPIVVNDEYDSTADSRMAMSKARMAQDQFWRQHRHFGASMVVIGHGDKGGISSEIYDRANTIIEKPDDTKKGLAIIYTSGLLNFRKFADVDPSRVDYNPHGSSTIDADASPYVIISAMSEERSRALENGEEWGHSREVETLIDLITRYRASKKEMAEGKDGIMRAEIRRRMDAGQTDERIARDLATDLDRPWDVVRDTIVKDVRTRFNEEKRKRATGRHSDPSEIRDALDALKDISVEDALDGVRS